MKKVGLVLSGGGMRGVAHAGVLKFLDEKKISPEIISGTSAGAVVASLYAFGKKSDEILSFFQSVDFFSWKHLALNRLGIVNSSVFKRYLDSFFKKAKIRDARIPILITATNMSLGELHVFDQDDCVADAIIASSSFPGVVTPHIVNGVAYCDGGIINNFPVDLIFGKVDKIIGVYLSPELVVESSKLNSIKMVSMRAIDLLIHRAEAHKFDYCHKVIRPRELGFCGIFENSKDKMDKIFKIGYYEAVNSLYLDDF